MLLLKSCPHCLEGDLIVEEGGDGVMAECLQCGYSADEQALQWWLSLPQVTDVDVVEANPLQVERRLGADGNRAA